MSRYLKEALAAQVTQHTGQKTHNSTTDNRLSFNTYIR